MIKPHDIPTGSGPRPESGRAAERDELGAYLVAVAREDCYRVVRPLGAAARMGADPFVAGQVGTITELVQFEGANGATLGPFVRKRIDLALGVGTAYQELYEAQCSGARFAHVPRIVECYKTGRELVVVSEFIPGETLDAFVNEVGPSLELSLSVVPAVCAAVAELHKAFDPPVVHRDLKPANIIVSEGPSGLSATLIDFGIARRYREGAAADTVRFGTRSYAPPEQYGFGQTSVRSDIYALGMIALFCITGEEAHGQPSAESLAHAGVTGPYADAILQATSFDPGRRFASAEAFCTAFTSRFEIGFTSGCDADECRAPVPPMGRGRAAGSPAARVSAGESRAAGALPTRNVSAAAPERASRMPAVPAKCPPDANRRGRLRIVGHVRNALLVLVAIVFAVIATQTVGDPINGRVYPLWYSLYLTYVLCLPLVLGILYLLLDRACLARVVPPLASRPRKLDARNLAIYVVFAFALGVIANLFV